MLSSSNLQVRAATLTAEAIEKATLLPKDLSKQKEDGTGKAANGMVGVSEKVTGESSGVLRPKNARWLTKQLWHLEMTEEEARQKLRELARLRALQSQYEAKNRRINKIKSKAYRKIRKKVSF